jgi:hypothetical protein
MIARIASLMILGAIGILLLVTFDMSGYNAIIFTFVGHPLLVLGLLLGFFALSRRLRREAAMRRLQENV